MRCPKCGYISFDDLEVCKKCHKNFGGAIREIHGTAFHSLAPLFLQTEDLNSPHGQFAATDDDSGARELDFDGAEEAREGIDTEFVLEDISFDDGPAVDIDKEKAATDRDITLDMDGFDEVAPREEFTLDFDADRDKGEVKMPAIDFGDLDISDLAPPIAEKTNPPDDAPIQVRLEESAPVTVTAPPPKTEPGQESPLEDLQFNDLNLEMPAKFVTGSAAGKRHLPSVKTGTALDNFDINLGDLFSETTEAKK